MLPHSLEVNSHWNGRIQTNFQLELPISDIYINMYFGLPHHWQHSSLILMQQNAGIGFVLCNKWGRPIRMGLKNVPYLSVNQLEMLALRWNCQRFEFLLWKFMCWRWFMEYHFCNCAWQNQTMLMLEHIWCRHCEKVEVVPSMESFLHLQARQHTWWMHTGTIDGICSQLKNDIIHVCQIE